MKKHLIFLSLFIFSIASFTQNTNNYFDFSKRGEAYFSFKTDDKDIIQQLANIISIDKIEENGNIIAYANEKAFAKFLEFGIEPTILTPPSMLEEHKMFTIDQYNSKEIYDWDSYPTYEAYVAMMNDFETNFPNLCETIEFGTTVNNRKLLICKITSNINPTTKAKVHYSSTMHGDETTGYVLMLRLIDYLLNNYSTDNRIKNIIDNAEIWICPDANPDGTYYAGNNSVYGSIRYNGNNEDLNRNYKDDVYGNHPDGAQWQPETVAFMALQEEQKFHLSVNIHGGAEVCNYPWDNKNSLSADDSWWQYVCREYADTVHVYNSSYMTYLNNGITRGYSWYSISGSRQDYANYYDHCREFCLEISNNKTPSASQLPNFWNWNYRSFLNYIEQALYGIHGTVTDANTGLPLKCEVKIENHDRTESQVYSNPETGYYVRPIKAGTYTISYIKQGYETVNQIITISDKQKIIHDVQLNYAGMTASFSANNTNVNLIANNQVNFTDESFSLNPITQYSWTFEGGNPNTSNDKNPIITYDEEGSYYVSLTISDGTNSSTLTKEDYISVSSYYIMQNGSFEINEETTFYDSGGKDENYSNNENYTISFLPTSKNKALTVTFTDFDVEYHGSCNYDYLLIYDGSDISYPLLGKFCGSTIPGPFTSSADNGALTFVFHSDVADTGSGWKAIIENKSTTAPTADFSSENTFIVANSDIAFIDKSLNDPIEWEWTFEGGTPETSNEQNPTITYQQAGNFDVTLKVKNEYGEDVITKTDYIQVALSIKTLENNIKIYPNPAKDAINIQAETLIEEIEIIDLAGRKVNEVNIKDTNTIIDITNIPAGLYIINIQLENSSYSTKILIND